LKVKHNNSVKDIYDKINDLNVKHVDLEFADEPIGDNKLYTKEDFN
jgi:hypothetical protein